VNYGSGAAIHEGTMREGWENPVHVWVPSIGASGLAIYHGDRFPAWRGNLLAGGLAGEQVVKLTLDGDVVTDVEYLARRLGRIRDVREGPDGFVYLAVESRSGEPTGIVRLEPAY
jgi:glucose/arabinose dehydrogenase